MLTACLHHNFHKGCIRHLPQWHAGERGYGIQQLTLFVGGCKNKIAMHNSYLASSLVTIAHGDAINAREHHILTSDLLCLTWCMPCTASTISGARLFPGAYRSGTCHALDAYFSHTRQWLRRIAPLFGMCTTPGNQHVPVPMSCILCRCSAIRHHSLHAGMMHTLGHAFLAG